MIVNTSTPINNLLMTIDLKDISSISSPSTSNTYMYITYIYLKKLVVVVRSDIF